MVRALGLAGLRCVLVTWPGNAARHSRFVTSVIDDARDDLPQALLEHAERAAEPPVLFLAEDRALVTVDAHRERFEDAFRVALAPSGLLADLLDKPRFQRLAERLGLPVPRAVAVRDGEAGVLDGPRPPPLVQPPPRAQHSPGDTPSAQAPARR